MFSLYIKCYCNHENLSIISLITPASSRPKSAVTPKNSNHKEIFADNKNTFLKNKTKKKIVYILDINK